MVCECNLEKLKNKVICEFLNYLFNLEKGKKKDYEFILEEISLIDLIESGYYNKEESLFYIQYYLNNKWETVIY